MLSYLIVRRNVYYTFVQCLLDRDSILKPSNPDLYSTECRVDGRGEVRKENSRLSGASLRLQHTNTTYCSK